MSPYLIKEIANSFNIAEKGICFHFHDRNDNLLGFSKNDLEKGGLWDLYLMYDVVMYYQFIKYGDGIFKSTTNNESNQLMDYIIKTTQTNFGSENYRNHFQHNFSTNREIVLMLAMLFITGESSKSFNLLNIKLESEIVKSRMNKWKMR